MSKVDRDLPSWAVMRERTIEDLQASIRMCLDAAVKSEQRGDISGANRWFAAALRREEELNAK